MQRVNLQAAVADLRLRLRRSLKGAEARTNRLHTALLSLREVARACAKDDATGEPTSSPQRVQEASGRPQPASASPRKDGTRRPLKLHQAAQALMTQQANLTAIADEIEMALHGVLGVSERVEWVLRALRASTVNDRHPARRSPRGAPHKPARTSPRGVVDTNRARTPAYTPDKAPAGEANDQAGDGASHGANGGSSASGTPVKQPSGSDNKEAPSAGTRRKKLPRAVAATASPQRRSRARDVSSRDNSQPQPQQQQSSNPPGRRSRQAGGSSPTSSRRRKKRQQASGGQGRATNVKVPEGTSSPARATPRAVARALRQRRHSSGSHSTTSTPQSLTIDASLLGNAAAWPAVRKSTGNLDAAPVLMASKSPSHHAGAQSPTARRSGDGGGWGADSDSAGDMDSFTQNTRTPKSAGRRDEPSVSPWPSSSPRPRSTRPRIANAQT